MSIRDHVHRVTARGLDCRALRALVLDEIRKEAPFDWYVWLLTDPETGVGSAPLADVPSLGDLPTLIRLKYLTPVNRWSELPSNSATTLQHATKGDRSTSLIWRQLLAGYGVDDVLSIVFRDQYGCWGFLDLWRLHGSFSTDECAVVDQVAMALNPSLRTCLAPAFANGAGMPVRCDGPAVLLLSGQLRLLTQTPQTEAFLRALLPTPADRSPVPAAAYNVAAQLLARESGVDAHQPSARVHVRDGIWVTLRAARIDETSSNAGASIAVSIELTAPSHRTALYSRVLGLSERESELLQHLVGGCDTRELADRLFVSRHTVQDHLKSIFDKAGVNSRRLLIARATGSASDTSRGNMVT